MSDRNKTSTGQSAAEARAEYEANRAANAAARERRIAEAFPHGDPGKWVSTVSIIVTVAFALVTLLGAIDPEAFIGPYFVVTVGLFTAGFLIFLWVLVGMALRSRDDLLSIAGVFFLSDSAPTSTRRALLGTLAAQVVIAVVGAAARPFTPLAVGTLVPLFGLAVVGLWAVRYGHFEAHPNGVSR